METFGPRCSAYNLLPIFRMQTLKHVFLFSSLLQGDCWICMELMSTSFDKFYKYVYCSLDDVIPEEILGKITLAVSASQLMPFQVLCCCQYFRILHFFFPSNILQTVKALNHLKENLKIIHRGECLICDITVNCHQVELSYQ